MKKITILFLSLLFSAGLIAQEKKGVNFEDLSFSQALAKAKNNKKGPNLVFLDCYTTWCGPCKHMANVIFPQEAAGKYFNAHFVNIKIDMEKGEGIDLAKQYKVSAYPTFLLFDGEGKEIGRIIGGGDLETFIKRVDVFINPAKSPSALKAVYEAEKSTTNAIAYMESLIYTSKQQDMASFVNKEFDNFEERDKYTEKLWKYISQSMTVENSKALASVIATKYAYDMNIGKAKVDKALTAAYKNIILGYISGKTPLSKEGLDKAVLALSLLYDGDEVGKFYVIIANEYAKGDLDRITNLFHLGAFGYNTTDSEKAEIERLFIAVKGMPKEKIREYYEGKSKTYKSQSESFEKQAGKYTEEK